MSLHPRLINTSISVGKEDGLSLHPGVAARAHERDRVERLCRGMSGQPLAEPKHGSSDLTGRD